MGSEMCIRDRGTGNPFPVVPSTGGDGSPGFLRLEAETAPSIASEETKVSPRESEIRLQYGPSAEIEDVISSVVWQPVTDVPSGWSGAESCWIRPTGNFFKLVFADDSNGPGWDMELDITGQATPQSFRGPNDVFPGMTLEQVFGTDFGTSPILVRFQSARAVETLVDPCSVPESGPSSPLSTGSRTEWVRHPSLLNDFNGQESLTPNVMRFLILWDRSQVDFNLLEAVESLTIRVRPD